MKRSLIFWIVFFVLTLFSCGGGGSSGGGGGVAPEENKPPVADAGSDQVVIAGAEVTLDGSGSSDPDDGIASYRWEQVVNSGGPVITLVDSDTATPTFTAPIDPAMLEFELTVKDGDGEEAQATCVVDVLTQGQVEDVVYAAYAGIGYMSADPLIDDDEALYDVMFDDPNSLMGSVFWDVFNNTTDLGELGKLLIGQPASLHYDHEVDGKVLYSAEIYIKPDAYGDCYSFTGTLSIDFKTNGYPLNGCTYFGDNGADDLVAGITGYYEVIDKVLIPELQWFILRSLRIEVRDSLTASYPSENVTVTYDQWEISYEVYYGEDDPIDKRAELNLEILPVDPGLTYTPRDFRDYTLGGSFSIDGNEYTFDGFHYVQELDTSETLTLVLIDGTLSIPGLDGSVTIDTPYDVIRSSDGIWTSGEMTLSGVEYDVDVEFENGTANFSGDLGPWPEDNWQDVLAPY